MDNRSSITQSRSLAHKLVPIPKGRGYQIDWKNSKHARRRGTIDSRQARIQPWIFCKGCHNRRVGVSASELAVSKSYVSHWRCRQYMSAGGTAIVQEMQCNRSRLEFIDPERHHRLLDAELIAAGGLMFCRTRVIQEPNSHVI